jgi:hypothetical protein
MNYNRLAKQTGVTRDVGLRKVKLEAFTRSLDMSVRCPVNIMFGHVRLGSPACAMVLS